MYSTYSTHRSNETIFSPLSWGSHRHRNVLERSRTAEVGVVVSRTRRLRRRQQRRPRGPGRSAGTEQLGSGLGMRTSGPYQPGLQLLWPGLERELPSAASGAHVIETKFMESVFNFGGVVQITVHLLQGVFSSVGLCFLGCLADLVRD